MLMIHPIGMIVITLIEILVMTIKNHFDDDLRLVIKVIMMKMADFTNYISDSDRSRHTADGEENDRGNFDLNLMHLTSLLKMKIAVVMTTMTEVF